MRAEAAVPGQSLLARYGMPPAEIERRSLGRVGRLAGPSRAAGPGPRDSGGRRRSLAGQWAGAPQPRARMSWYDGPRRTRPSWAPVAVRRWRRRRSTRCWSLPLRTSMADAQAQRPPSERQRRGMREGFTTGTCATAASLGATRALIRQQPVEAVTIHLPAGRDATFPLAPC